MTSKPLTAKQVRDMFAAKDFAKHSTPPPSSVECPVCKWGFHPAAINQHIREKHDAQATTDNQQKIKVLKAMAVKANELGDDDLLNRIIHELDAIWMDDAAAHRFYTMLELTAVQS